MLTSSRRGECHDYDVFASDLEIRRPAGDPIAVDTVRLVPKHAPVTGPAVFGANTLMGTLCAVSPLRPAAAIADELHAALASAGVRYGVSVLPQEAGAWVRVLGTDPPALSAAMRSAWDAVRRFLIGVPAPVMRKA